MNPQLREQNIEAASRKLSESFGQAVGSTSISFLDKSYQLSGSYDEQLKEFRGIIQRALLEAAGSK